MTTDVRVDALLDAWLDERALAKAAELRAVNVELAAFRLLEALAATSFQPTPALEEAIAELERELAKG
jgi:hypothetical protein